MRARAERHVLHDVAPGRAELVRILELLGVVIAGREHHQQAAAGRDRDAIEGDFFLDEPAPALDGRVDAKRLLDDRRDALFAGGDAAPEFAIRQDRLQHVRRCARGGFVAGEQQVEAGSPDLVQGGLAVVAIPEANHVADVVVRRTFELGADQRVGIVVVLDRALGERDLFLLGRTSPGEHETAVSPLLDLGDVVSRNAEQPEKNVGGHLVRHARDDVGRLLA